MTLAPYSPIPPLTDIAGGPVVMRRTVPVEYNLTPNIQNQLLRSGRVVIDRKSGNTNYYLLISLLYEAMRYKEEFPMRGAEVNWKLIQADYEMLIAGEAVLREGIIQPEPEGEGPAADAPGAEQIDMGNILLEEQLEFIKGLHIPQTIADRAKNAGVLSKAITELVRSTENQIRVMRDAGQLVDVREAEVLIRLCLEDMLAEVADLPNSYGEQLSEDLDCDIRLAKRALESVSKYLSAVVQSSLDKIDRETASFMTSKATQRRAKKERRA